MRISLAKIKFIKNTGFDERLTLPLSIVVFMFSMSGVIHSLVVSHNLYFRFHGLILDSKISYTCTLHTFYKRVDPLKSLFVILHFLMLPPIPIKDKNSVL
jgi:hypothetical protein